MIHIDGRTDGEWGRPTDRPPFCVSVRGREREGEEEEEEEGGRRLDGLETEGWHSFLGRGDLQMMPQRFCRFFGR